MVDRSNLMQNFGILQSTPGQALSQPSRSARFLPSRVPYWLTSLLIPVEIRKDECYALLIPEFVCSCRLPTAFERVTIEGASEIDSNSWPISYEECLSLQLKIFLDEGMSFSSDTKSS